MKSIIVMKNDFVRNGLISLSDILRNIKDDMEKERNYHLTELKKVNPNFVNEMEYRKLEKNQKNDKKY
ncbi:Uncharacterised protein [Candidatus Tiddalikarchaeum anstoanum]|nr:Uncharacterised protein [Candidatus Tiddalikarchaeum anstoanum]